MQSLRLCPYGCGVVASVRLRVSPNSLQLIDDFDPTLSLFYSCPKGADRTLKCMKECVLSICRKIVGPITNHPAFFVLLAIIMLYPACVYGVRSGDIRYVACAIPVNVTLAYVLSLCVEGKRVWEVITLLLFGVFSLVEAYLAYAFGSLFTATILQVVMETNPDEVAGFVDTYLLTKSSATFFAMSLGVSLLVGLCYKRLRFLTVPIRHAVVLLPLSLLILCAIVGYVFRDARALKWYLEDDVHKILDEKSSAFYAGCYTTIGNLGFNAMLYIGQYKEIQVLADTMLAPVEMGGFVRNSDVVVVVGESFNKHHSSLYGYELATNPRLRDEVKSGNLYPFEDVVTPYNYTHQCMRTMLSFYSQDLDRRWCDTPLYFSIFRAAGFQSLCLSNQEVKGQDTWSFDFLNSFMVASDIASKIFDGQNAEKYEYDMALVDEAIAWHAEVPQLWFFHLIGQHSGYEVRYPAEEAHFSEADYLHRSDLSDSQRRALAHYDNATLYNDKVVATIFDQFRTRDAVVIYLSDHGEEVFDYRDHMGRSHEPVVSPELAKYQFEVPFMIWMSDSYKENHPDVVARVERSVNRPYMTDDLPHLLLDLAGIECEWFDPTRSVINDRFNANRKRLLLDSKQDYDAIMKGAE